MTLAAAQCGTAAARALAVSLACLGTGAVVHSRLLRSGLKARRAAWILLLLPYLAPSLLVGYAYSNFSLSLVHHPRWNEALYGVLLWLRLTPVAALVLYLAPATVSRESVHCRKLLRCRESGLRAAMAYLLFLVRGVLRGHAAALTLVFLLAFGEFELASLMGVRTWTVTVFDAHAGGLMLRESLRLIAMPALAEAVLLAVLLVLLSGGRPVHGDRPRSPTPRAIALAAGGYLVLAALVAVGAPSAIVLRGTLQGLRTLMGNPGVARDILAGVLFAGAAGACVYFAAGPPAHRIVGAGLRKRSAHWAVWLCLPGLMGPLVLSLLLVFVFQAPGLRALYDTPVPLLLGLCVVLFPFAVVLRALLWKLGRSEGVYAARLLRRSPSGRVRAWGRRLILELRTQWHLWVLFLLFCWGYFDMTASSILAPAGMTPASVRLYNLMHYGQTSVLSAMVLLTLCVPLAFLVAAEAGRCWLTRRASHG